MKLPPQVATMFPKVKLKDIDWKWAALLAVMMFVTIADDPTVVGEFADVFELPLDVLVAMILSRNSLRRAAVREATVVQGTVVNDGSTVSDKTVPDVVKKLERG